MGGKPRQKTRQIHDLEIEVLIARDLEPCDEEKEYGIWTEDSSIKLVEGDWVGEFLLAVYSAEDWPGPHLEPGQIMRATIDIAGIAKRAPQ